MKFTKEQAVEKLNQALTNAGKKPLRMSARTLDAQTENLMALIGDEEMELDDFVNKVKASLESVNSQIEHDNSEFIKEYKKANPAPAPAPKPKDAPEDGDPVEGLREEIKQMRKKIQDREDADAIEAKRAEIRKYLDENNVKDAKWIDSVLSLANIGKDDDAQAKGKSYLELYNLSRQGSPITPKVPTSGSGEDVEDQFAEVRALRNDPDEKK